jgi:hypothetical protein
MANVSRVAGAQERETHTREKRREKRDGERQRGESERGGTFIKAIERR